MQRLGTACSAPGGGETEGPAPGMGSSWRRPADGWHAAASPGRDARACAEASSGERGGAARPRHGQQVSARQGVAVNEEKPRAQSTDHDAGVEGKGEALARDGTPGSERVT